MVAKLKSQWTFARNIPDDKVSNLKVLVFINILKFMEKNNYSSIGIQRLMRVRNSNTYH